MYLRISPILGRGCVRLGIAGVFVGGAVAFGNTTLAQVVPDDTVGSTVSGASGGEQTITGGTTQGGNLFHSFQQFSVPTNGTAFFNNATDIQNILTRVTGGSRSDIDGLIRANGTANLFLLNPNGIVFGRNARLNIGGSFIATTANSINFADGTQFSATPGTGTPLLTVSVPLGLQFGASPREIVNRSLAIDGNEFVGLQVQLGKSIGLIGGNVSLEAGGELTAAGGRIELGAVATPGVVGINTDNNGFRFSFPTDLALGDISLLDESVVDVMAGGGGSIAVNARNLNLFGGSQLVAGIGENQGAVGAVAGDIDVNAQEAVTIIGTGQPLSSGILNNVQTRGTGKGGNVNVTTGSLFLSNGGFISAGTFGFGDTGEVNIIASDAISIDGLGTSNVNTGVFSRVRPTATGNGGGINIKAQTLSLTNGATITTSTSGQGNAGNIDVQAQDSISLDNSNLLSNVNNQQATTPVAGNVGSIRLKSRTVSFANGAQIQASFLSDARQQGSPGVVSIEATDSISFAGRNSDNIRSAIFTDVESGAVANGSGIQISAPTINFNDALLNASSSGQGDAGSITVQTRSLDLTDNSLFTTSTSGQGNAGNIQITATAPINSVSFSGGSIVRTSSSGTGNAGNVIIAADGNVSLNTNSFITSNLNEVPADSTGQIPQAPNDRKGGGINIKARSLSLTNGSRLNASTLGSGNAGNIFVEAKDIFQSNSDIFNNVEAGAVGNGGTITIIADSLSLKDGAQIQALVRGDSEDGVRGGRGNGGEVTIEVRDTFSASGNNSSEDLSAVFTSLGSGAVGSGGDINIKARSLSLTDGGQLNTDTFGEGNAGNIDITVDDAVTFAGVNQDNRSGVFSRVRPSGNGNGGNINLSVGKLFLNDGAQVNAVSNGQGNAGNIRINAKNEINIDGLNQEFQFPSAIGSSVEDEGTGNGGNINIAVRDGSLSLTNGGLITAGTFSGQEDAGNIGIKARTLNLDNGIIFAGAILGNSGDISVQASKSVRLRNDSLISTSTGSGNGGNITINSPLVIAEFRGNNDIFANAFDGEGGEIKINAQSIFGLRPRTGEELQPTLQTRFKTNTPTTNQLELFLNESLSNDVAAISVTDPSLSGTVSFNADYIDPSRDIVELPTGLVDASSLVAAGCPSGAENRFTVAGRGGLPPTPSDKLSPDALLTDWAILQTPDENRAAIETTTPVATNTTTAPLVEASSWQYDRNGAIILTSGDTASTNGFETTPSSCPSS